MYGLINNALKDFIIAKTSRESWEQIRRDADIENDHFPALESYPDAATYALLTHYCKNTGQASDSALEEFGRYWVSEVAAKHYGYLLKMTGRNFREFIANLDLMHERVSTEFNELVHPSFSVVGISDTSFHVHYRSHRVGLAPFVLGLLHGLGNHFEVDVQIEHIASGHGIMNSEVFLVKYV